LAYDIASLLYEDLPSSTTPISLPVPLPAPLFLMHRLLEPQLILLRLQRVPYQLLMEPQLLRQPPEPLHLLRLVLVLVSLGPSLRQLRHLSCR